jgi:polysaccharide deacetylase family protein (PEP-CTERM system associated)
MPDPQKKARHLLTVLVEDYFHVGAFDNLIQQRNWGKFEPRYERNTLKALDLLDEYSTKATFFVLGWIAEHNHDLVREIASRGHEVASRGYYHRGLKNLTADEFRSDIRRTNGVIEAVTGRPAVGYRAAEKLRYKSDEWIFDILADEGFAYDASFIPTRADGPRQRAAHQIHTGGRALWEFPYSTRDLGVGLLPISGGNYFRQIPYTFTRGSVRGWARDVDAPFVSYFHVWELDPEQPRISAASRFNRLRHYRKLDKMEWILRENMALYDCVSIADHLGLVESPISDRRSETEVTVRPAVTEAQYAGLPVTIIIPCYNEQDSLAYLANTLTGVEEKLIAAGYSPEILFVNDKSTDATLDRLETLFADRNKVRIVSHDANKGVAAAIMTGIRESSTEIVCSMDCDCTYDPEELANMLPLLKGGVDLVTASPYHPDGGVRNVPGWRLFLSRGASFLYRNVLHSDLSTFTSCFRAYRRSSFLGLELEENGFLGVAEMLGKIDLAGGRIVEFPTTLDVRLFGFSKMKTARTILGHVRLLTRLGKQRLFGNKRAIETSIPLEEKAP